MEVHLTPDVEAKLARLAAEQGRNAEALAQEVIEQDQLNEGVAQKHSI